MHYDIFFIGNIIGKVRRRLWMKLFNFKNPFFHLWTEMQRPGKQTPLMPVGPVGSEMIVHLCYMVFTDFYSL